MSLADKKGVWIWELAKLPRDYLERLKKQGVGRVFLKTYDGKSKGDGIWRFQATAVIVETFKRAGIEVWGWGYHYGDSVAEDFEAVRFTKAIGCAGYVLDVEQEFKAKSTHANLEALLERCEKELTSSEFILGFTSFGHAGFHSEIPWKLLYSFCDVSLPQIYYEKFGFGTDEHEIKECMKSNMAFGVPAHRIWPIFGSESDTKKPASKASLQEALDSYPSASIWRLPNAGERGEAFNLVYGKTSTPDPTPSEPTLYIPTKPLSEELFFGRKGEMVAELQKALASRGIKCAIDGDFGQETQKAVKSFELDNGLNVNGVVEKDTWEKLGGKWDDAPPAKGGKEKRIALAKYAATIAVHGYELHSKDSFVWKEMVAPLVPAMKKLGHIGDGYVFVNWCACFVTYVARKSGYAIPDQPAGFWASMALVDAWVYWAKKNGTFFERREINPQQGDICVYDWNADRTSDHIGIVDSYNVGSSQFVAIEGNKSNVSGVFTRQISNVRGWIRLP